MKAAIIQAGVRLRQEKDNFDRIISLVDKAIEKKSEIIVLPEMWTTGLFPELEERTGIVPSEHALEALLKRSSSTLIIAGSLPEKTEKGILNTSFALYNGRIIFKYSKTHLFAYGGENQYTIAGKNLGVFKFSPEGEISCSETYSGESYRIPEDRGFTGSILICFDLRFPELFRKITFLGAEIIFLPAQFPMARLEHWRKLLMARAIENQAYLFGANACGHDGRLALAGHSMIVDPWGEVLGEAGTEDEILIADISPEKVREIRKKFPFLLEARLKKWFEKLDTELP